MVEQQWRITAQKGLLGRWCLLRHQETTRNKEGWLYISHMAGAIIGSQWPALWRTQNPLLLRTSTAPIAAMDSLNISQQMTPQC